MPLHPSLDGLTRSEACQGYVNFIEGAAADGLKNGGPKEAAENVRLAERWLCQHDLFYLLVFVLNRHDANRDWLFARCREVQARPHGVLDLWARTHYKSTIITHAGLCQEILNDPETTIGIFSDVNKIAKPFLRQHKTEFEENQRLKDLFPDILYANPKRDSPKWNEDDGITVKRQGNPKECTIEAYGLIDGQPIGRHFRHVHFDDLVTEESVHTPEAMDKVKKRLQLATNLASEDGVYSYAGTRYHALDPYQYLIDTGIVPTRIHPATDNGKADGRPVLLTEQQLREKRIFMGPYVFASQMLLDPRADAIMSFNRDWLRFYPLAPNNGAGLNRYILVDPSSGKKAKERRGDYTAMWVIGLGADGYYYVVDMLRERLNLTARCEKLFQLVRTYKPLAVGYESYGMQGDSDYIESEKRRLQYQFVMIELGGSLSKNDRIAKLIPTFEQGRILLPEMLTRYDPDGRAYAPIRQFIDEEFVQWPLAAHDDALDALARIHDPNFPMIAPSQPEPSKEEERGLPVHILRNMQRQRNASESWATR